MLMMMWCQKNFLREINYYVFWNVTNHFFKVTCPFFPWKKNLQQCLHLLKDLWFWPQMDLDLEFGEHFLTQHTQNNNIDFCPQKLFFKKTIKDEHFLDTKGFFFDWNRTFFSPYSSLWNSENTFRLTPYCFNDSVES